MSGLGDTVRVVTSPVPVASAAKRRLRWAVVAVRRLALAAAVGGIALAFATGHDTECKDVLVGAAEHHICAPITADSGKFLASAAVVVVLASFELSELEVAGIKVKQLERKVQAEAARTDQLQLALNQALVSVASSSSQALGLAQTSIAITVADAGRALTSGADLSEQAIGSTSAIRAALAGWWADLPEPWGNFGALVLLAPDPVLGLSQVAYTGVTPFIDLVWPRLVGVDGIATAAIASADPQLVSLSLEELLDDGVRPEDVSGVDYLTVLAARSLTPQGQVAGVVVTVGPGRPGEALVDDTAGQAAAELLTVASGWAFLARLVGGTDRGHQGPGSAQ